MKSLPFLERMEGEGVIRIKTTFEQDLDRLFTDSKYYKEMQEKGRNFIVNNFSWDVSAQIYLENFR